MVTDFGFLVHDDGVFVTKYVYLTVVHVHAIIQKSGKCIHSGMPKSCWLQMVFSVISGTHSCQNF